MRSVTGRIVSIGVAIAALGIGVVTVGPARVKIVTSSPYLSGNGTPSSPLAMTVTPDGTNISGTGSAGSAFTASSGLSGIRAGYLGYFYALGYDGTAVMDGTTTVAGMTPATVGSLKIYTAAREYSFANLTINTGVEFKMNSWRLFVRDTLTVNGAIQADGNAATSTTSVAAIAANTLAGATGGTGGGNFAGARSTNAIPAWIGSSAALGGPSAGVAAGAGDVAGRGGGGGWDNATGPSSGDVATTWKWGAGGNTFWSLWGGRPDNCQHRSSILTNCPSRYTGGSSAGSGGRSAVGNGGGVLVVVARLITGSGAFRAKAGASYQSPNLGFREGGGGGSGGGLIIVIYNNWSGPTTNVSGATATLGCCGGGNGGNGAAGRVYKLNMTGDGS